VEKTSFFFAHNSVCESYNVTKWIWTKITAKWKREKDDSFTTLRINLCDEPCSVAKSSARRRALDCPVFRLSNCQLIDIFVNCSWIDTQWQQYSTHLHANSTQNNTINLDRLRAVPRLCELYPGICLTAEEKSRKNFSQGSRRVSAGTMKTEYTEQNIHKNKNTKTQ